MIGITHETFITHPAGKGGDIGNVEVDGGRIVGFGTGGTYFLEMDGNTVIGVNETSGSLAELDGQTWIGVQ